MDRRDSCSHTTAATPPVTDDCLSDRVLDDLVAGNAGTPVRDEHLRDCARCQARLALFQDHQQRLRPLVEDLLAPALRRAPPDPALRPVARGWLQRWSGGPVPGLVLAAAAAAVVLAALLLWPDPETVPPLDDLAADGLRLKGTSMRFFVLRGDDVTPGESGVALRAGDALRFAVSCDRTTNLFLVGIEESGPVSAYYPYGGRASVPLSPGVDQPLPGSLVLDDAPQSEAFVGLFSTEPLHFDRIEEAAAAALRAHDGDLEAAVQDLDLPGQHRWVVVHKEQP
jgi:hypothetical protein